MGQSYLKQYADTRERVKNHKYDTTSEAPSDHGKPIPGYVDSDDADRILKMADAYDANNLVVDTPDSQETKAPTTLKNYLSALKSVAVHVALTDTTATELNTIMQGFHDGSLDGVKEGGLTKGSVRNYQNALKQFYFVFDDVGVDPADIALFKPDKESVDPADMLTREEIQAIRDAATCARDRALFDFLLYTGQRNTATRSLRIKDLDLENERFRLNPEAEGLKDAEKNGKWRDLLLSAATIRNYLNNGHPAPDDPDAYVFVALPKYATGDPHSMLDVKTIGEIIGRMVERAAADCPSVKGKPTYPHALRHNFVTIALRRGMKESAIKHQIGHKSESTVMETTYAHLKDSDHIRAARDAFDLETEPVESELTPEICPKCGESPPENARLCHWCGLPFTPDARERVENADDAVRESYQTADPQDADTVEMLQLLDKLMEKPNAREMVLDLTADANADDDTENAV